MDNRFLPLVVVAVMLALGLTLTVARLPAGRHGAAPTAGRVGLSVAGVARPVPADRRGRCTSTPNLAVGLMLMAATPGGMLANIVSHLANGDLALNLTLTAINAVLSIFTIPAILAFSLTWFLGEGRFIPLQFDKFFGVFAMVLIPVAIGVAIRHRFPDLARRLQKFVRDSPRRCCWCSPSSRGSPAARRRCGSNFGVLSAAVASFCAVSLTVGYLVPRRMHLAPRQAIAVSLEIGLHNAVVAIGIALSPQLLNNPEMAMPAAVYGIIAPFIALAFVFAVRRLDPAYRELASSPAG